MIDLDSEIIKVDRYEARVINGVVHYFAICGKEEIEMPEAYHEMYDNDHLAIRKRHIPFPEVFGLTEEEHYIPLNTTWKGEKWTPKKRKVPSNRNPN